MKAVQRDVGSKKEEDEATPWKNWITLRADGTKAVETSTGLLDEGSEQLLFLDQRSRRLRYALTLAVFLLYAISFPLLYRSVSNPGIAALITLPVAAAAWLLGLRAALLATLLSLPLNTLLLHSVGEPGWDVLFRTGGLPALLALLLVSIGLGQLRDLSEQIKAQAQALARDQELMKAQMLERQHTERALRESEERYRLMVEGSEQVFFYFHDTKNCFRYLSPSVRDVLGYELEELIGHSFEMLLTGDQSDELVFENTASAIQSGQRRMAYLAQVRHKDGRYRILELVETPFLQDEQVLGVQGFARDITERKQAERLQAVLYEVAEAVYETPDLHTLFQAIHHALGKLIDVQNFYVALCEREHPDTFSFPYEVDEHDSYRGSVRQLSGSLTASVARRGEPLLVDRNRYEALADAGEIERYGAPPASWLGVPLILDESVIGVVAVQSYADDRLYTQKDIEIMQFVSKQIAVAIERKRAEQALLESREYLRYMAHHDPLTHLPNRVLFYDRLKYALAQARRYKRDVALLFIDLDGFKAVNDTLGHDIGDMLLQEVSHRLSACVRESDTVARMGGDEFTTILPDIYHRDDATLVAQKILASLVQPFVIAGHSLSITASIGLSLYPSDTLDMEELIRQADHAMYHAKESGKNQYYWAGAG